MAAVQAAPLKSSPDKRKPTEKERGEVLEALTSIMDPDLGRNIVDCGFIQDIALKEMQTDSGRFRVDISLQLTTPACPVKEEFKSQIAQNLLRMAWVGDVRVDVSSSALAPSSSEEASAALPEGLRGVRHVIAVSSCKGGVGKSSVSVNLAYTLAMMGAKVGIFDADVYGPSLPIMVSPEKNVLEMDPETKAITPVEYEGVKMVSFGFTNQGSAIMRGAMVSGLVQQLLTTTKWGDLDYLIMDFPPGTGDIQLTIGQALPISAAVIVTTPQKLAFTDVAKGIRMFARLKVPCVSVVENMSYFETEDGKRHFPFGTGSGERIQREFSIPSLTKLPIVAAISEGGDRGRPVVIAEPNGQVAKVMGEVGASLVMEVAKMQNENKPSASYDAQRDVIVVNAVDPDGTRRQFALSPALVRKRDLSAKAIDEWTKMPTEPVDLLLPDSIRPESIEPLGNYAVQILWGDGFNQIAPFDQLYELEDELE